MELFFFLRGVLNKNAFFFNFKDICFPFVGWHKHELFLRDEHFSMG